MNSLYEIITALQTTQGNNAKRAILEANYHNNLLEEYLRVTYDPRINFYVTEKTFPKQEMFSTYAKPFNINDIENFVHTLANRVLTGNDAKQWLKLSLSAMTNEGQQLIRWMLLKDIKAGISVSTINKVWPNLIFSQKYMRCSLPKDVKLNEWPWEKGVYSQVKMDGMYAAVSNKQVITRNGSVFPYELLPADLKEDMAKLSDRVELNGELLVVRNGAYLSRKEGNGILNSLLQGTEIPEGCSLVYVAWDGTYSSDYADRWMCLTLDCKRFNTIKQVENRMVHSYEEAVQHFQEMLSYGLEGTVLKHPVNIWRDGTSKHQVKFKIEADIDLICTCVVEGTGKYKGMLGALQLESACGKVKVDCGTGFTDKQRKELFDNPPIGKVIEIKANDLLDRVGSDTLSLFLPVFKSVRLDKDVADDLERIECSFNSAKGLT